MREVGRAMVGGHRRNRALGPVSALTKSDARKKLDGILSELKASEDAVTNDMSLSRFIEGVYYPFYARKRKRSTAGNNINRVNTHVVAAFGSRKVREFRRDDLQNFLDQKGQELSFSMADHLRWDLKQIFDMAVAEDLVWKKPGGAAIHTW